MPDFVSKLLRAAIWSCWAFQFQSSRSPFLWQEVNLDLLLRTGFDLEHDEVLFLCHIFTQRPKQWALFGSAITSRQFHRKFHFTLKKVMPECYKSWKPFWLSNWVRMARVVERFLRASWQRPAATAKDSETPCVYACPPQPAQAVQKRCPKSFAIDFAVKLSIVFWNSLREWLPDDWQKRTWTQTWTVHSDQRVVNLM